MEKKAKRSNRNQYDTYGSIYNYEEENELPKGLRNDNEKFIRETILKEVERLPKGISNMNEKTQPKNIKYREEKETLPKGLRKETYKYNGQNNHNQIEVEKMTRDNRRKKRKKKNKIITFFIIIIMLIVIVLGVGYGFIQGKLGKMQEEKINIEDLEIDKNVDKSLSEYRNIAIFGVDSRQDDYGVGNRSDCIIIASINNNTKEVKLISVYRDTYVQIEGHGLDKINHAYSYGGSQLAIKTLNANFDLNIKEFVTVNFNSVAEAVNALNGVTIDVTNEELKYINKYVNDTQSHTGIGSKQVTKAGKQTLDGVQAVAYSRIRYTEGGDYKRTERMRTVINAMMEKAKTLSLTELNKFTNELLPEIRVSEGLNSTIWSMIPSIKKFKISDSIGWPYEVKGYTGTAWYGVPVTLESNVIKMHKEIFGEENYTPSEKVKTVSNSIISKTGYR
ncbi:MAG: LCP family protein [Clostridia bacterium]|nr:LCP family protein [Clostridia bacterium]